MYLVTTISYDALGALIRDKKVCLDNGKLLFGNDTETIDKYFKDRIGYDGYVVGLRGRLNKSTADIFSKLDRRVAIGEQIILEAEIEEDDMLRYTVEGLTAAASAIAYGMPEEDVVAQLDSSKVETAEATGVEVLCVPYIDVEKKVRVTRVGAPEIGFNVEGITFVKLR